MLLFDMTTTALNNYQDSRSDTTVLPYDRGKAKWILLSLLALATLTGLLLAWLTGPVVLAVGALCFLVGILYTFGPAPISRMPLGELFSGIFLGFFVPFLVVFINAPSGSLVEFAWTAPNVSLTFNLAGLLRLVLLATPAVCCIANVMLANNICDVDHDIKVDRFTLPYYLGRKKSLALFAALYIAAYAAIVLLGLLQILPPLVLLTLLTSILVIRNVRLFYAKQVKSETFAHSVANLVIILLSMILLSAIGLLLGR
jgi:1,4-dihydroxy-2-naphthoate octaprenyltransferase